MERNCLAVVIEDRNDNISRAWFFSVREVAAFIESIPLYWPETKRVQIFNDIQKEENISNIFFPVKIFNDFPL